MSSKSFSDCTDEELMAAADLHDERADLCDGLDLDDRSVAGDFHATRASEIRSFVERRRRAAKEAQALMARLRS